MKPIYFATVCSGIGAPEAAWSLLGWKCLFQSEIEPFPSAILKHHYPEVPNLGDMKKYKEWPDYDLTDGIICAGTPCQAFSIAGLRKGLDDPRGNLTLGFLGILSKYRPRFVLWENVPGVFSEKTGAFDSFIVGLQEIGYGVAWTVLDAQYANLAQRRERVFVVGCLGDWRRAAAVLFDKTSLCWYPAPSREKGEGIAPTISARTKGGGGLGTDAECDGALIAFSNVSDGSSARNADNISDPITCRHGDPGMVCHSLRADGFDASEDGTGRGTPLVPHISKALNGHSSGSRRMDAESETMIPIAIAENQRGEVREMDQVPSLSIGGGKPGRGYPAIAFSCKDSGNDAGEIAPTLRSGNHTGSHANGGIMPGIASGIQVRRLTPRECERLQGFPDDYTAITYRGKPAKDGPRYKALGNSMAVPVVRWIGKRIEMVESYKNI